MPDPRGPVPTAIALFRQTAASMVGELATRLDAAGFPGLSPSLHPVFENIDATGTRLTELAARAGMTHQSMGEIVAKLEKLGYLTRTSDPADRRARLVCLTPQGRRLVRRAVREISAIWDDWAQRLAAAGLQGDVVAALEMALKGGGATPVGQGARSAVAGAGAGLGRVPADGAGAPR
jgi:DNA-binding MarR family transcriptional regulator